MKKKKRTRGADTRRRYSFKTKWVCHRSTLPCFHHELKFWYCKLLPLIGWRCALAG
jgi:hypothetical protein